jgi:Family of unknown function (DUF5681)
METGYGKPPSEHRFKPGQSGNPNGRPKTKAMTDRLREAMAVVGDDGLDMGDVVIRQWLAMIKAGNVAALVELLNRLDGPVSQSLRHQHDGVSQIRVVYTEPEPTAVAGALGILADLGFRGPTGGLADRAANPALSAPSDRP